MLKKLTLSRVNTPLKKSRLENLMSNLRKQSETSITGDTRLKRPKKTTQSLNLKLMSSTLHQEVLPVKRLILSLNLKNPKTSRKSSKIKPKSS